MKIYFALLTVLGLFVAAPAQAAVTVDLRFNDGSKTMKAFPGVYSIDVWAQVTGANTTPDEGLLFVYGAVRSTQVNGGAISSGTSGITANVASNTNWTVDSPFGQAGTAQNVTLDGIQDWGTLPTNNAQTIKYSSTLGSGLSPVFLNTPGQTGAVNALTNGVEFKVGTLTFTLSNSDLKNDYINEAARLAAATNIDWVLPSGSIPNRHNHRVDGGTAAVTSTTTYLASAPGNGVSFTAVPEPGTWALGGMLLAGLAGLKLRRKKAKAPNCS
jgi:hypothetical protein